MRVSSFHRVAAIRQQHRAGSSVLMLAQKFDLAITTVEEILRCRTREAAAMVLDAESSSGVVRRFVLSDGRFVDFTSLINQR